jgi:CheY-like chemotaxis protein
MIMKLHDARNPTPIIAMTGGHMQSDLYLKVAKSLGARRVMEKPFKLVELSQNIRDVLAETKSAK